MKSAAAPALEIEWSGVLKSAPPALGIEWSGVETVRITQPELTILEILRVNNR